MLVDSCAAVQFLQTAYEPDDWIAIFLKSYETGRTAQRVGPIATFLEPRFHAWLRAMNAQRFNVYVSVNAIQPGVRARTKEALVLQGILSGATVREPLLPITDEERARVREAMALAGELEPALA